MAFEGLEALRAGVVRRRRRRERRVEGAWRCGMVGEVGYRSIVPGVMDIYCIEVACWLG